VAFCVRDVQYPQRAPGSPAVGLIRALLKEEVAGTAEDVVRLVKDSRCNSTYLALLQLLDDPESAKLLGELLRHEQTHYRREAIRIIGARGLQQYAGALLEIATAPVDPNEKTRLLAEYEKGKVSKAEFENRMRILQSEPQERRAATLALIEMNDRNAWQVVRAFLETEYLEHGQYGTTEYYLHSPIGFGLSVAKLKPSRGEEIRALLAEEISGQKRDCVIDLLTTALCVEPDPADVEPLWTVASTADMREPTRVLAAVALARLGERRVVPVLHEWVRKYTAPGPGGAPAPGFPGGVFTVLSSSMQRWMNRRWESLLDSTVTGPPMSSPKFEPDQADIGLALRRLGDETLVPELVQSLGTSRGDFNMTAYRFLAGITGVRAYDQARNWMEAHDCVSRQTTAALIGVLQGLGVSESELLPLIAAGEGSSRRTVFTLTTCDSPAAADAVVAAYRDLSGYAKMNKVEMVESLCRSGDPRGLALAAEDPLLFASVVKYVPEADPVDFPAGHFEYNRIEEAMRVQAWYRQHADALKWDADSGTFRLAAGEK
jgi:hypothetical protein